LEKRRITNKNSPKGLFLFVIGLFLKFCLCEHSEAIQIKITQKINEESKWGGVYECGDGEKI